MLCVSVFVCACEAMQVVGTGLEDSVRRSESECRGTVFIQGRKGVVMGWRGKDGKSRKRGGNGRGWDRVLGAEVTDNTGQEEEEEEEFKKEGRNE